MSIDQAIIEELANEKGMPLTDKALKRWQEYFIHECGYRCAETVEKIFAQARIGGLVREEIRKEVDAIVASRLEAMAESIRRTPDGRFVATEGRFADE